ncbi:hypothetical protein LY78DRAFT_85602 [Colletotrichum sublineola]|nr:hypothetical protein LY78DRAFT_85602 [Colletotrichum sublineola]
MLDADATPLVRELLLSIPRRAVTVDATSFVRFDVCPRPAALFATACHHDWSTSKSGQGLGTSAMSARRDTATITKSLRHRNKSQSLPAPTRPCLLHYPFYPPVTPEPTPGRLPPRTTRPPARPHPPSWVRKWTVRPAEARRSKTTLRVHVTYIISASPHPPHPSQSTIACLVFHSIVQALNGIRQFSLESRGSCTAPMV